jgi:hypothetical protein
MIVLARACVLADKSVNRLQRLPSYLCTRIPYPARIRCTALVTSGRFRTDMSLLIVASERGDRYSTDPCRLLTKKDLRGQCGRPQRSNHMNAHLLKRRNDKKTSGADLFPVHCHFLSPVRKRKCATAWCIGRYHRSSRRSGFGCSWRTRRTFRVTKAPTRCRHCSHPASFRRRASDVRRFSHAHRYRRRRAIDLAALFFWAGLARPGVWIIRRPHQSRAAARNDNSRISPPSSERWPESSFPRAASNCRKAEALKLARKQRLPLQGLNEQRQRQGDVGERPGNDSCATMISGVKSCPISPRWRR